MNEPALTPAQTQGNTAALGFPVSVTGKMVQIPRKRFLEWLGE